MTVYTNHADFILTHSHDVVVVGHGRVSTDESSHFSPFNLSLILILWTTINCHRTEAIAVLK